VERDLREGVFEDLEMMEKAFFILTQLLMLAMRATHHSIRSKRLT
jgi:hypothetical protein